MIIQIKRGISTIRGSDKNSRKYVLSAAVVGASGLPKLVNKMPVFLLNLPSCGLSVIAENRDTERSF